jgi:hypothetical protein
VSKRYGFKVVLWIGIIFYPDPDPIPGPSFGPGYCKKFQISSGSDPQCSLYHNANDFKGLFMAFKASLSIIIFD